VKDYSKYKVVIFSLKEPTSELSSYCFKKLGFSNVSLLDGKGTFVDKFIEFSKLVNNTDFEYYIRSDSDRFVFDCMCDFVDNIDSAYTHFEGYGFDYFMNKFRGATPQIYHRSILLKLFSDNSLISNVPKPENNFCKNAKVKFKSLKIFTNLHDYYQQPSKVCNTFLNRMIRDNIIHYDLNYIKQLPKYYVEACDVARAYYSKGDYTKDMNYKNFDYLDDNFNKKYDLELMYFKLKEIYNMNIGKFREMVWGRTNHIPT